MPYVILQGYTVLIMLWLALALPSRYTRGTDILWIFAWYVLAKVFEALDVQIFAIGNVISGHTLKHVAAAMSGFVACAMLARRTLVAPVQRRQ